MSKFQVGDRVRFSNVKSGGPEGLSGEGTIKFVWPDETGGSIATDAGSCIIAYFDGTDGEVVEKAHRFAVGQRVEVLPNDIFADTGETTIEAHLHAYGDETAYGVANRGFVVYERFLRPAAKASDAKPAHDESASRKATPVCSGVLDYFPAALEAVAKLSKAGNDKHNPGQPLHHARGKSTDHADCLVRHLIDRGHVDPETGLSHTVAVAWRALAMLQEELEAAGAPLARGARKGDKS